MSEPIFSVFATDTRFTTSPAIGEPDCLCSRCGKLIEEGEVPIRAWPADSETEYRYHPACLGFTMFEKDAP